MLLAKGCHVQASWVRSCGLTGNATVPPLLPVDANSAPWQAGRVMQHLSLAWRSLAEKNFVKSANAVAKLDLSKVRIALSDGLNGL